MYSTSPASYILNANVPEMIHKTSRIIYICWNGKSIENLDNKNIFLKYKYDEDDEDCIWCLTERNKSW